MSLVMGANAESMLNAQLEELAEAIGNDGVLALIDIFVTDTPASIEALTAARNSADTDQLRAIAHGMKSSARYVGLDRLGALSETVEHLVRDGRGEEALAQSDELVRLAREGITELQTVRPQYAGAAD